MKSRLYSLLKFIIGWPLSIIAFFFIGKILFDQAPSILPNVQTIQPFLLGAGIFSLVVFYVLRSLIWHRIIKSYGYSIPLKESAYLWSMSELKRYIPGNVWSFLGRTLLFEKKGVAKKDVGKGLLIEAELFVIGSFVVSLLALPYFFQDIADEMIWVGWGIMVLGVLLYSINRKITKHFSGKLKSVLEFILPSFSITESLRLIVISSCSLFFFGLGNYLVMSSAFGTDPLLVWELIGVFAFAFVAGYLSIITPAGFGVREGITIFALSQLVTSGLAAFAALFTRIILIVAELLFILFFYLWHKSKHTVVLRFEQWMYRNPYELVVIFLSLIYTVYISAASIMRYNNYYTGRFDLGNMVQTVWNTLHGNFFIMTNPDSVGQVSRLAFHADFILVLLAPLYALWQDPRTLLIIQSVVIAIGAYFIFLIAKDVLKNKSIAVVLSFAYLINPSVQRANIYDFHAVVLATTFLLATFYFYYKRKYIWFAIFALLAAMCKEQIWLIIALFGILVAVHHRKWIIGAGIFMVCTAMFFFLLEHAIPAAHGSNHFALEYYSGFGSSTTDIAKAIILQPDKVLMKVLEPDRFHFITQIFSPLGYLSYVFPFFLIFAGPDLLISLLSSNSNLYQIYYQYTATMTPFIFLSAIYGIWVLQKLGERSKSLKGFEKRYHISSGTTLASFVIIYVLYNSIYTAHAFGPLPGSQEPNTAMFNRPFPDREFIDQFLSHIPQDYTVAASNNIGSHLSQREVIYVLPYGIDQADMVVISDKDSYADSTLKSMEKNGNYHKTVDRDGFWVYERK